MAKVYLETSFISACVTDRTDPASIYRRDCSLDWWDMQRSRYQLVVSNEVIAELSHPIFPLREAALAFITAVTVLPMTDEMVGLAEVFVRQRVMPGPLHGDCLHVATATIAGVEYMLSWNVRHLANPNKTRHLAAVCLKFGLVPPRIVTPDLLWEDDDGNS